MTQVCTKESPMPSQHSGQWQHPDAELVGSDDDFYNIDSYDLYKCPNCGLTFKVTVGQ